MTEINSLKDLSENSLRSEWTNRHQPFSPLFPEFLRVVWILMVNQCVQALPLKVLSYDVVPLRVFEELLESDDARVIQLLKNINLLVYALSFS